MNTLYAIKDKKSGRYFTNNAKRGSFYVNLNEASFYRTTEGAQKTIDTSRFVRSREADPTVVEIRLTEVEPSQPIEMLYAVPDNQLPEGSDRILEVHIPCPVCGSLIQDNLTCPNVLCQNH